jgi:hypothetical protein
VEESNVLAVVERSVLAGAVVERSVLAGAVERSVLAAAVAAAVAVAATVAAAVAAAVAVAATVVVSIESVVGVEVDSVPLLIAVMGQSCTTFQCQCLWFLILTAEAQEVISHVTEADIFPETCHLGTLSQYTPLLSTTACLTSCTMTVTQITRFTQLIKDPTNTPLEIIIFELFN